MKVKRTLALSALLVCLFAVPVLAAYKDYDDQYGYAYLQTNTSSGMREAEAGTIRKADTYWGWLYVKRTYDDGSEYSQKSGNVRENIIYDYGWEWVDSYESKHRVFENLPYKEWEVSFSD